MPGVIEGGDLRIGRGATLVFEEDVIGAVGVEGGIEVDEVNALSGDPRTGWRGCRRSRGCLSSLFILERKDAIG